MPLNREESVREVLKILKDGLIPFIEQQYRRVYAQGWQQEVRQVLREFEPWDGNLRSLDSHALFQTLWFRWNEVFFTNDSPLRYAERQMVSDLWIARHKLAHEKGFSTEEVYRVCDNAERLLTAIRAGDIAALRKRKQVVIHALCQEWPPDSTTPLASTQGPSTANQQATPDAWQLLYRMSPELQNTYESLEMRVRQFGSDVTVYATRYYIRFRARKNFLELYPRARDFQAYIYPVASHIPQGGTGMLANIRLKRETPQAGFTLDTSFTFDETADLDAITPLLHRSYEERR